MRPDRREDLAVVLGLLQQFIREVAAHDCAPADVGLCA
jgi:hypothetical protein